MIRLLCGDAAYQCSMFIFSAATEYTHKFCIYVEILDRLFLEIRKRIP